MGIPVTLWPVVREGVMGHELNMDIHLLTQLSLKYLHIFFLFFLRYFFYVNDLVTLSFINSKICDLCLLFLFQPSKKCFIDYEK